MNILCTGANGVVGRALLNELRKNNSNTVYTTDRNEGYHDFCYDSLKYDVDLLDYRRVQKLIHKIMPDVIYHLAAVSTSSSTAEKVWQNTNMTLNLLEACRFLSVKPRFVQASSIVVENYPASVYSISKLACERLVHVYTDLYESINGVSVRFPAVVGAGARHGLLPDLIKKVLAEGDEIELFGDEPGSVKPFIHSIRLADYLTRLNSCGYPITLCPVNNISVKEVAEIVMKELSITKKIKWDPSKTWKGDQNKVYANSHFTEFYFEDKLSSQNAILAATRDIMKEQYGK